MIIKGKRFPHGKLSDTGKLCSYPQLEAPPASTYPLEEETRFQRQDRDESIAEQSV